MIPSAALFLAALAATAHAADPWAGCAVDQAGFTTRISCGAVTLIVVEGAETELAARLSAHLAAQAERGGGGEAQSEQTALQSTEGLLPASRTAWTPKGASGPTESWLTVAAPAPVGSVLVTCKAPVSSPDADERCDAQVRQVAKSGLPPAARGLIPSQGGDWADVEAKVGRSLPSLLGCETQARGSSLVHLCGDGVLAVALIPSPRSGGEVWQRQFLDGVLGGLPRDHVVGSEDTVPCQLAGTETTCTRVHVDEGDDEASWVVSGGAQGVGSYYTAICTYPDVGYALPQYCRALFGDVPPTPQVAEETGRRRRRGPG